MYKFHVKYKSNLQVPFKYTLSYKTPEVVDLHIFFRDDTIVRMSILL